MALSDNWTVERITDPDYLPVLHDFCKANYDPRWHPCAGSVPYPTVAMFQDYLDTDHVILGLYNGDLGGSLGGFRVNSKSPSMRPLWAMLQKWEANGGAPALPGVGIEALALLWAASWHFGGGKVADPEEDVTNPKLAAIYPIVFNRADAIYAERYL